MSVSRHKVGLVVDREFGDRMVDLARSFHLWVVESPTNSGVVRRIWNAEARSHDDDALGSGVTSFEASESESPEEMSVRISGDLDEHHGEFAHDPPWSEIEVYGATLTESVKQAFRAIGATVFERTRDGFRCVRTDTGL
jgi:hypothetical protein